MSVSINFSYPSFQDNDVAGISKWCKNHSLELTRILNRLKFDRADIPEIVFSAYNSANYVQTAGSWEKIRIDTVEKNEGGCFDNSLSRFTPNKEGYYQINAKVNNYNGAPNLVGVAIYKNGAVYKTGMVGINLTGTVSSYIYMNGTTDYVELYAYLATNAGVGGGNVENTWFNGSLVLSTSTYTAALAFNNTAVGLTWTPLTSTLSLTAGYVIPTTTEETNWNTAYGWGNWAGHTQNASTVLIPNGIGTPTYDDMQDYLNLCQSSGRLTGGTITEHTSGGSDGSIDISEMEGFIHTANTKGSPLIYFKKAATQLSTLTDQSVNYIIATYSAGGGGTITYSASLSRPADNTYNAFVIGRCFREGTEVECLTTGQNIFDMYGRQQDRLLAKYGAMDRASGAVLSANATPLQLDCTAGVWYFGNSRIDTDAKTTYNVWYKTGGSATWVESATKTLFSDIFNGAAAKLYETYQNGNSLGTLSGSKYGVYWVFVCPNQTDPLYIVMGTGDYANIGAAQAASVPASLPPYCVNWGKLVGKVICQKTGAAFYSVESSFATSFTLSAATDHASLANLPYASAGHTGFQPTINQALETTSSPTFANITDSGLTSGRVPYASTAGLLVDSANLTFNGTNFIACQQVGGHIGFGVASPSSTYKIHLQNNVITDFTRLLLVEGITTGTNLIVSPLTFRLTSTGDMADGFGPGFLYCIQDTAGAENYIARTSAIRAGADHTGRFNVDIGKSGTLSTVAFFSAVGASGVYPALTLMSNSATNGDGISLDFVGSTGATSITARIAGIRTGASGIGDLVFYTDSAGASVAERMRITSTGVVSITALTTAGILHNAVTTGIISSSLIVNVDIHATAGIELSKLATQAAYTLVGNNTASAAVPTALSVANVKSICGYFQQNDNTLYIGDGSTKPTISLSSDTNGVENVLVSSPIAADRFWGDLKGGVDLSGGVITVSAWNPIYFNYSGTSLLRQYIESGADQGYIEALTTGFMFTNDADVIIKQYLAATTHSIGIYKNINCMAPNVSSVVLKANGDVDITPVGTGVVNVPANTFAYSKIQQVSATSRVLGRISTGAGNIEELTGANIRTIAGLTITDVLALAGLKLNGFIGLLLCKSSGAIDGLSIGDDPYPYTVGDEIVIPSGNGDASIRVLTVVNPPDPEHPETGFITGGGSWEWVSHGSGYVADTPTQHYNGNGTGFVIGSLVEDGEVTPIANGADGDILTMVSGVPTWVTP